MSDTNKHGDVPSKQKQHRQQKYYKNRKMRNDQETVTEEGSPSQDKHKDRSHFRTSSGHRTMTYSELKNKNPSYGNRHQEEAGCNEAVQMKGEAVQKKKQNKTAKQHFETYWSTEQVQHGLKRGELIQGALKINPKNYEDAYIPHPNGHTDIYICGMKNRNRALNGDIVAVLPFPREQWKVFLDDLNSLSEEIISKSVESIDIELDRLNKTDNDEVASNSKEPRDCLPASDVPLEEEADQKPVLTVQEQVTTSTASAVECAAKDIQSKRYTSIGDLKSNWSVASPSTQKVFLSKTTESTKESGQLPDTVLQMTGKVVYIIEKKHSRACSGSINLLKDKNPDLAMFSPKDSRVPRMMVPMTDCPKDFKERPQDYSKTLFIARIVEWPEKSKFPRGSLMRSLGEAGEIEPETEGILMEHDVDFSNFSEEVLACLPQALPWHIPEEELANRKDLRNVCVFTIDPSTARDLDDALSCVKLDTGLYEVGVHIADVSYFIHAGSELDKVAASRATSVYLVQKVIPMLPGLLCEQLCSLNPGEDRLTFSVIWTITEDGLIESEWFGRTIIHSCVKLSYEHAQGFIENPSKEWTPDEIPPISCGYSVDDVKNVVLQLDKIAKKLRKKRIDNGCLRLDQIKLQFSLDKETGLPNGYSVYQQKDSNRLVEEFMLLANMAVARKIYKHFPEISVLRRHPKPQSRMLNDLAVLCKELGVPLDVSNSKTIQQSLDIYSGDNEENRAKFLILTSLCSKPMQNARYFCTGAIVDESLFHHYALNVPFYTHFTSPIRRYPDIMVHRLLGAALEYCEPPNTSVAQVQNEAEHCNDKKLAAKRVSELSSELYFAIFVKECGPIEEQAMVMAVLDKAFDVLILKLGVIKRVYLEKLSLASSKYSKEGKSPCLNLTWAADDHHKEERHQIIKIFTPVNCRLLPDPAPLKWNAVVLHPDDELSLAS